ncbi:MAG: outer membrane beta-barrel protein [Anaeromyxobacter sp.]
MSRNRLPTLLALALAAAPAVAAAQYSAGGPGVPAKRQIELTGFAGYQLNSDIDTSAGSLEVGDTEVYGASLGIETLPGAFTELTWFYSDPTARVTGNPYLLNARSFQMPTHYFQIGGRKGIQRGRVNIFGAGSLGAALFMPEDIHYGVNQTLNLSDSWRFAFTLGAGVKVDLAKHLALRFDARVAAPISSTAPPSTPAAAGRGCR